MESEEATIQLSLSEVRRPALRDRQNKVVSSP